ncbi:Nudix hydrolase 19, chloroplastic [Sesamum angolense]|uniref:NAD(+) diphosphatase n=1 Tax=Sesamum angolense TaxID=2727404 RepID=A0AAE1X3D2_9LAMI|nr:Nudix hydrolase 19, chloroplastic [Sesamum angolense]
MSDFLGALLIVATVPGYPLLRQHLLHLAPRLASLPEEVKRELEDPNSRYNIGWSHGKEKLESGKLDLLKGSFYANPILDIPTTELSLVKRYPSYCGPNMWPRCALPELEPAFKALGKLILDVGLLLAHHCDRYGKFFFEDLVFIASNGFKLHKDGSLHQILLRSRCHKGRLLYYFPSLYCTSAEDDETVSSWCGWHTDHGSLTGLTCGMFTRDAVELPCPDSAAGLYVKTRSGQIVKVVYGEDEIAYQIGETTEILSRGQLCAHHIASGHQRERRHFGVERSTFALFMQPDCLARLMVPYLLEIIRKRKGRPLAGSETDGHRWHLGWLSISECRTFLENSEVGLSEDSLAYLGCKYEDDAVYWAMDVSEASMLVNELGARHFCFVELRTLMVATDWADYKAMGELAIAGHARALLEWHNTARYCGYCGGKTVPMEAGRRKQCSNELCKKRIYPRVDPVVIMLVIDKENDRALLSRQSRFVPRMWSCLAGFIEPGESLEEAVRRETWEETGIEVGDVVYHSSQPWPGIVSFSYFSAWLEKNDLEFKLNMFIILCISDTCLLYHEKSVNIVHVSYHLIFTDRPTDLQNHHPPLNTPPPLADQPCRLLPWPAFAALSCFPLKLVAFTQGLSLSKDAKWHSREEVKKALTFAEYEKAQKTAAAKVEQMCKGVEKGQNLSSDFNVESGELAPMFVPGPFAIAHHLISSWANLNGVEPQKQAAGSLSSL